LLLLLPLPFHLIGNGFAHFHKALVAVALFHHINVFMY